MVTGLVATQLMDFGVKLAVGTGAALVLIISQLGVMNDYISFSGMLVAAILVIGSLLSYIIARYSPIRIPVIADAQQKFDEVAESTRGFEVFYFDPYMRQVIETSVLPVTWAFDWGMRRKKNPTDGSIIVIQQSKKVACWLNL